jgi:hypothetical protein
MALRSVPNFGLPLMIIFVFYTFQPNASYLYFLRYPASLKSGSIRQAKATEAVSTVCRKNEGEQFVLPLGGDSFMQWMVLQAIIVHFVNKVLNDC